MKNCEKNIGNSLDFFKDVKNVPDCQQKVIKKQTETKIKRQLKGNCNVQNVDQKRPTWVRFSFTWI